VKTRVNTYKADYTNKIVYWTNQLNESINCAPIDKDTKKMQKALDSLNYFASKQIQIERMDEQVNEMIEKSNSEKIHLEFKSIGYKFTPEKN
tara:strand:+ start:11782 stop:12057 length:276 start_codon:yes stop_codon:yes gene_type:complete